MTEMSIKDIQLKHLYWEREEKVRYFKINLEILKIIQFTQVKVRIVFYALKKILELKMQTISLKIKDLKLLLKKFFNNQLKKNV